jgi:N-acetylglucosamine kinase-like BadF-type ATPase
MITMRTILAIDAGGTSTRAAVLDDSGRIAGVGAAASGNPTSAGIDAAVGNIATAARRALDAAGVQVGAGSAVVIALAGANTSAFRGRLHSRMSTLGFEAEPIIESDLLAMYFSGTHLDDGYALIAGTGAVAARVASGRLERVAGGTGWLLGDAGSGFWIGHQVVRAVVAALDGQGPQTKLTAMLSKALDLPPSTEARDGRPVLLDQLIAELYEMRPVEMSRFAPMAFAATNDPVARGIVEAAITELVDLLVVVLARRQRGPIVVGGSVLKLGILAPGRDGLADAFHERLAMQMRNASVVAVSNGVVGACVLGLRHTGTAVGSDLFTSLRAQLADGVPGADPGRLDVAGD